MDMSLMRRRERVRLSERASEWTRNKFVEQKRIDNTNRKHANIQWNLLKTETEIQLKLCKHFRLFVKLRRNREREKTNSEESIHVFGNRIWNWMCASFGALFSYAIVVYPSKMNCVCVRKCAKNMRFSQCVLLNNKNTSNHRKQCVRPNPLTDQTIILQNRMNPTNRAKPSQTKRTNNMGQQNK